MLETIVNTDIQFTLFLNSFHNSFFDFVMYWLSDKLIWVPFYIFLVYLLYRKYGWKTTLIMFAFIILGVALADSISRECFKNVVQRLRPCHNEQIGSLIHIVNGHCGGSYGFVSSHAANTFVIATIASAFLKVHYPVFRWALFVWAALICYSRVYLGVHFVGDITCGSILGITVGVCCVWLYKQFRLKFNV